MAGRPLALGAVEEGWRKGPWTAQEDKLLIEYVSFHGEGRWNTVARLVGLKRNGKSCRLRWVNYLRPGLKRGQISPEEEKTIIELHARWGNRWSTIARSLPGRTDNEVKNYWRTHFKKNGKPSYNSGKARTRPLRRQQKEHHQQVLEQTNQVDMKKTTSQFEEGDYKVSSLSAQVRPEMILMYPTSEEQCLSPTLRGNGPFPETTSSDDGLWSGLWNFYDDHGSSFGNMCITSKAMEQNQMAYFYPGYFN